MSDAQVAAWLRSAGLSRFAPRFAAAEISSTSFLRLTSTDLDAIGVDGPADRKRLVDLITDLRRTANLPSHKSLTTTSASTRLSREGSASFRDTSTLVSSRPVLEALADRNSVHAALSRRKSSLAVMPLPNASTPTSASAPTTPREPSATVRVCVRKRPLSRKELTSADRDIVAVTEGDASLVVHELKEKVDLTKYIEAHMFSFDHVFGEHVGNACVYDATARPLVDALFAGGRATCFAYGQTGAGKTFTMAGDGPENPGLYTLAVRDVFDRIRDLEREAWREAEENGDDDFEPPDPPQVWISFYEIYAARLQDLLNCGAKLECREDANNEVQIIGLTERLCEVEEDVLALVKEGSALRSTGVTGANDDSSRSHAVFQIELRDPPPVVDVDQSAIMRENLLRGGRNAASRMQAKGDEIGRLCFIDLAGSERGSDTASSTRQTRMEGAEINKSLLALKECIRAMDKRKDHTPFRGSKLTQVLKASFMGKNCRTVMIANISPSSSNCEHTLNTLRYSDRVKEIRKERPGSASVHGDGGHKHGSRRATISHGIGLRGSRTTHALPPSSSKSGSPVLDADGLDDGPKSDRRVMSLKSESDVDDGPQSMNGVRTRSSAASTRRSGRPSRTSDYPLSSTFAGVPTDPNGPGKSRQNTLLRAVKGTSSHLPSRPSMASSMLPRAHTKLAGSERVPRANSGLARLPTDRSDVDAAAEGISRVTLRSGRRRAAPPVMPVASGGTGSGGDAAGNGNRVSAASPAMTRQRRREMEAMQEDRQSESPDSRDEESSPDDGVVVANRVKVAAGRRRPPRQSNAAESAMRYYQTKKNELPEEDLLFASSDDMADATDVTTEKRRMAAKPIKADDDDVETVTDGKRGEHVAYSSSENETGGSGAGGNSKVEISAEVKQVVRMHHMQIEELMRLTEADVTLVNDMEKGKLDAQEYALKLSVNLSQKLDIVKTLQAKVKMLE